MSKGPPFHVRENIFLSNSTHLLIIFFMLYVLDKTGVSLGRLKILNHALGFESCDYSWRTNLHGSNTNVTVLAL
jgi:hypothetical protein